MRILITTPIYPPETRGPATYLGQLIPKLRMDGHRVTVITFTNNSQVISIAKNGGTLDRQIRLFRAVFRQAKNNDLIYIQGADVVGFVSAVVGKILRKPTVIKFVGDLTQELKRDFGRSQKMATVATWLSLRLASRVIFPAKHLQRSTVQKYNIPIEKTRVIYNAIE